MVTDAEAEERKEGRKEGRKEDRQTEKERKSLQLRVCCAASRSASPSLRGVRLMCGRVLLL